MISAFLNCWEIKKCGRQKGGLLVAALGECIASVKGLGHSCWAIAGTLCGGVVQGTAAQKEGTCLRCSVYTDYNRMSGKNGQDVKQAFPDEEEKRHEVLRNQLQQIHDDLREQTEQNRDVDLRRAH